jgi:class 3 adenylate cyclase
VTAETGPAKAEPARRSAEGERCPTCGAELPRGFRFCGQCGRALAATLAVKPGEPVTIVFIDIEGFTPFSSRAGEDEMRELIRVFHWLVREEIARHRGFEVKQLGDGFMVAFADAARAIAFAAAIQRSISGHPVVSAVRLCVGINSGRAIREGDDFFGHAVNVASRIAARATGGQVLISGSTRKRVGTVDGVRYADLGRRRLRGLDGRFRVYEVLWGQDGASPA